MGLFDDIELEEDGVSSATLPEPPGKKGELFGDVDIGDIDLEVDVPDTVPSEPPQKGNLFKDIDIGEPGDTKESTVEKEEEEKKKRNIPLLEEVVESGSRQQGIDIVTSVSPPPPERISRNVNLGIENEGIRPEFLEEPLPGNVMKSSHSTWDTQQATIGPREDTFMADKAGEIAKKAWEARKWVVEKYGAPFVESTIDAIYIPIRAGSQILEGLSKDFTGGSSTENWQSLQRVLLNHPRDKDRINLVKVLEGWGITNKSLRLPEGTLERTNFLAEWEFFSSIPKIVKTLIGLGKVGNPARVLRETMNRPGTEMSTGPLATVGKQAVSTEKQARRNLLERNKLETELKGDIRAKVEGEQKPVQEIEALEGGESPKTTKQDVYAETGGFAESEIAQNPPLVEMPELVSIAKDITKNTPVLSGNLLRQAEGGRLISKPEAKRAGVMLK